MCACSASAVRRRARSRAARLPNGTRAPVSVTTAPVLVRSTTTRSTTSAPASADHGATSSRSGPRMCTAPASARTSAVLFQSPAAVSCAAVSSANRTSPRPSRTCVAASPQASPATRPTVPSRRRHGDGLSRASTSSGASAARGPAASFPPLWSSAAAGAGPTTSSGVDAVVRCSKGGAQSAATRRTGPTGSSTVSLSSRARTWRPGSGSPSTRARIRGTGCPSASGPRSTSSRWPSRSTSSGSTSPSGSSSSRASRASNGTCRTGSLLSAPGPASASAGTTTASPSAGTTVTR
jgi:hypothetical protein